MPILPDASSRPRLWTCIIINQCATPGLGSLWANRRLVGTGQLLLALAGFFLIVGWMFKYFFGMAAAELGESTQPQNVTWMLKWGVILFGSAWVWAGVSSIGMWREAKQLERDGKNVPPKL